MENGWQTKKIVQKKAKQKIRTKMETTDDKANNIALNAQSGYQLLGTRALKPVDEHLNM